MSIKSFYIYYFIYLYRYICNHLLENNLLRVNLYFTIGIIFKSLFFNLILINMVRMFYDIYILLSYLLLKVFHILVEFF